MLKHYELGYVDQTLFRWNYLTRYNQLLLNAVESIIAHVTLLLVIKCKGMKNNLNFQIFMPFLLNNIAYTLSNTWLLIPTTSSHLP